MQFRRGFSRAYLVPTLVFIIFPLWVSSVLASTTNRTIDDTTGDSATRERPVYLPAGGVWKDATCRGCAVQPDPSRAYGRTWTAATYSPSIDNMTIQFEFRGIALDVYFILANSIADVETTSVTKCDFILDGVAAGSFLHTPSPTTTEIQYNAVVFSRTGLANEAHTFVIRTSADHDVYVNFDYAQYIFVDTIDVAGRSGSPPGSISSSPIIPSISTAGGLRSSSAVKQITVSAIASSTTLGASFVSSSSTVTGSDAQTPQLAAAIASSPSKTYIGAIIGGAIGGVIVLAAIAGSLFFCYRRKHRAPDANSDDIHSQTSVIAHRSPPNHPPQTSNFLHPHSHTDPTLQFFTRSEPRSRQNSSASRYGYNPPPSSASLYDQPISTAPDEHGLYTGGILSSLPGSEIRMPAARASATGPLSSPGYIPRLPSLPDISELRQQRQMEVQCQIQQLKEEMESLSESTRGRKIGMMQEQMIELRNKQQSPWGQGLPDELPPTR